MRHELIHLYGPFSIYSYGLTIAIGLLIFSYVMKKHPQFNRLRLEKCYTEILLVGVIAALFGGRFLYVISHTKQFASWLEVCAFWEGGLSLLGSIIATLIAIPAYLRMMRIPIVPVLDLLGIHIPLLQSISRVGCFFAGCCYGNVTTYSWGVVYTDTQSMAPLYQSIHPTQIYSAIALLIIFAFMYFVAQKIATKPGQLITTYLMLVSTV